MARKTENKYLSFDFSSSSKILERVKKYIKKYDCPEITLDLSGLNLFEASRVMVLSSTYHYKKYPEGKLKCHVASQNVLNLVSGLPTKNLEIV